MSEKRNKQYTCKWEPNCDDDYRRPYGNCPDNCPNYKENKSVEELQKENEELKAKLPHWEDAKTSPTEPGWYLVYAYGEDQEEEPGVGMGYWDGTEWHAELDLEITVLQWTYIPKPEVTK